MIKELKKQTLRNQWEYFVKYGEKNINIPTEILSSWVRCKEYNVDPYGGVCIRNLNKYELKKTINENQSFLNIVKYYSQKMYECIRGMGFIIFYTDKEGNILYLIGDNDIIDDFQNNLQFKVGVVWNETTVGTTAVSMVMMKKNPVPFISEEKYCMLLKQRACCAVPIKCGKDELIGVLGIATNANTPSKNSYSMLLLTQTLIESNINITETDDEISIMNIYYKTILNSISEGILTTDPEGRLIDINKSAEDMLYIDAKRFIGKDITEIVDARHDFLENIQKKSKPSSKNFIIDINRDNLNIIKRSVNIVNKEGKLISIVNIIDKCKPIKNSIKEIKKDTAKYTFNDIIGNCRAITVIKDKSKAVAKTSSNVLIIGKTGVGKELFAQAIHNESEYRDGPFVAINCGAIPKELIESELFGYDGGSFTGAKNGGRPGKFEIAFGGTIFLDEIGEMSMDMQVRLLRVLQEKEITRIGGNKAIPINVRIIAATNKDLLDEVKNKNFREDLFWRLNVVAINIPSLYDRKKDIPILIDSFLKKNHKEYKIHEDTMKILINCNWHGNVRELHNVLENCLIFAKDNIIMPFDLPEYLKMLDFEEDQPKKDSLEDMEKYLIIKSLKENKDNINKTAKILGISRNTLYSKLAKYKIDSEYNSGQ